MFKLAVTGLVVVVGGTGSYAIAYWDLAAWVLPFGATVTTLGRAAWILWYRHTGTLGPNKIRFASIPVLVGIVLAGAAWAGIEVCEKAPPIGALIYAASMSGWLLIVEQDARKRARAVDLPPLAGKWRRQLDESMQGLGEYLGRPDVGPRILGDPEKPRLNLLQILALLFTFLFALGMVGFDGPLKEVLPAADSSPTEKSADPDKDDRRGNERDETPTPTPSPRASVLGDGLENADEIDAPMTPDDCLYPDQRERFREGIRDDVGDALFEAWEDVGVPFIGCLEDRVDRVHDIWMARLTGWGDESGLVVSDVNGRAAVVFFQLRERVEALVESGELLYAGERVKLSEGNYQVFFLTNGSCRLAVRHAFGEDVPYVFPPAEVSVLIMEESLRVQAFPAAITESSLGPARVFTVDFASTGSYSPPSARIVLEEPGRAYVSAHPRTVRTASSPCPDVREFDELTVTLD